MPCPITMRSTSPRLAPSAMRRPISCVRRETAVASTPPMPIAANTSATAAKPPSRTVLKRCGAADSFTTVSIVRTCATGSDGSIARTCA